jgi:hypothetical protein
VFAKKNNQQIKNSSRPFFANNITALRYYYVFVCPTGPEKPHKRGNCRANRPSPNPGAVATFVQTGQEKHENANNFG